MHKTDEFRILKMVRPAIEHIPAAAHFHDSITHRLRITCAILSLIKVRGSPIIKSVIGKLFGSVLICDFWGPYNKISNSATQRGSHHLSIELKR